MAIIDIFSMLALSKLIRTADPAIAIIIIVYTV